MDIDQWKALEGREGAWYQHRAGDLVADNADMAVDINTALANEPVRRVFVDGLREDGDGGVERLARMVHEGRAVLKPQEIPPGLQEHVRGRLLVPLGALVAKSEEAQAILAASGRARIGQVVEQLAPAVSEAAKKISQDPEALAHFIETGEGRFEILTEGMEGISLKLIVSERGAPGSFRRQEWEAETSHDGARNKWFETQIMPRLAEVASIALLENVDEATRGRIQRDDIGLRFSGVADKTS